MRISWVKGNKFEGDRITTIKTDGDEWFSIYKLALLTNQLAVNELKLKEAKDYSRFLFREAVHMAIEMAEYGIDWSEEKNIDKVQLWCKIHYLNFESIESDLKRVIQERLKEENE